MGTVYIEDLRPGMVLSADVRSRQGRLLFSEGLTLDELSIQTLKFWGVTETLVLGHDQENLDRERIKALDPAVARQAWEEANHRLKLCDPTHPTVRELKRVSFINLIQNGLPAPRRQTPEEPAHEPRKRPDLSRLASATIKLAALPGIVTQALEALSNPNVSYSYVAEIIGKDTALSAKLLKLVNSALYAFPESVDTISRAVTVVGANRLTSLALACRSSIFSIPSPAKCWTCAPSGSTAWPAACWRGYWPSPPGIPTWSAASWRGCCTIWGGW